MCPEFSQNSVEHYTPQIHLFNTFIHNSTDTPLNTSIHYFTDTPLNTFDQCSILLVKIQLSFDCMYM